MFKGGPVIMEMAAAPGMAMDDSSGGGQRPRVRTLFPETWVYESAEAE